jgi:hypothetical protein
MKTSLKMIVAASTLGLAAAFTGPAFADSFTVRVAPFEQPHRVVVRPRVEERVIVRPRHVERVVVRERCYTKTVKKITDRRTVITKTRVCP